jgi:RNA polymerase sigma-70 factor (ECF subfamily)
MAQQTGWPLETCKEIFAELSAYLDEELPPDACRQLEAHLSDCPPCLEFMNSLRKTVELCRRYNSIGSLPRPLSQAAKEQLKAAYLKVVTSCKEFPKKVT